MCSLAVPTTKATTISVGLSRVRRKYGLVSANPFGDLRPDQVILEQTAKSMEGFCAMRGFIKEIDRLR